MNIVSQTALVKKAFCSNIYTVSQNHLKNLPWSNYLHIKYIICNIYYQLKKDTLKI